MIKNIKIFGERNSGTTFCKLFLDNNLKNVNVFSGFYLDKCGWKHGFPKENLTNKKDTLFIFIIRDLHTWLNSMYHKPYHYESETDVNKFLYNKLKINDGRKNHPVNIDPREKDTIINLRYLKIKSYLNFFEKVNNAIFVNMEDLQKNKEKFIYFLSKTYNLNVKKQLNLIEIHTKTKKKTISNNYKKVIPDKINGKNLEIEMFVEKLKEKYHFKKQ